MLLAAARRAELHRASAIYAIYIIICGIFYTRVTPGVVPCIREYTVFSLYSRRPPDTVYYTCIQSAQPLYFPCRLAARWPPHHLSGKLRLEELAQHHVRRVLHGARYRAWRTYLACVLTGRAAWSSRHYSTMVSTMVSTREHADSWPTRGMFGALVERLDELLSA